MSKEREALAQPAPVLTGIDCSCGRKWRVVNNTLTASAAQPEQEPVAWANPHDLQNFDMKVRTSGGPLHTVPLYTTPPQRKESEQEPVAWTDGPHLVMRTDWRDRANYKGPWVDIGRAIPDSWVPVLYTAPPQPKQEPAFYIVKMELEALQRDGRRAMVLYTKPITIGIEVPVYTTPPQRTADEGEDKKTWVGLTDDEIDKYLDEQWVGYSGYYDCFKEVMCWQETKLKEKNA